MYNAKLGQKVVESNKRVKGSFQPTPKSRKKCFSSVKNGTINTEKKGRAKFRSSHSIEDTMLIYIPSHSLARLP